MPRFAPSSDYERLTAATYAEGMLMRERRTGLVCPFCHGGATKEASFSLMAHPDKIVWKCWRNSCGKRGFMNPTATLFQETETDPEVPANTAGLTEAMRRNYILEKMTPEWVENLIVKYGIMVETAQARGWMSNVGGKLVIPLRGCGNFIVGHEFRSMEGTPKSMMNLLSRTAFARNAFETKGDRSTCIIVEDSISALKVSNVCRAYSIQGTYMSVMHVEELEKEWSQCDRYLLALDKDASEKAATFVQRYSLVLPKLKLLPIQKDLKYSYCSEIEEIIKGYK